MDTCENQFKVASFKEVARAFAIILALFDPITINTCLMCLKRDRYRITYHLKQWKIELVYEEFYKVKL